MNDIDRARTKIVFIAGFRACMEMIVRKTGVKMTPWNDDDQREAESEHKDWLRRSMISDLESK